MYKHDSYYVCTILIYNINSKIQQYIILPYLLFTYLLTVQQYFFTYCIAGNCNKGPQRGGARVELQYVNMDIDSVVCK